MRPTGLPSCAVVASPPSGSDGRICRSAGGSAAGLYDGAPPHGRRALRGARSTGRGFSRRSGLCARSFSFFACSRAASANAPPLTIVTAPSPVSSARSVRSRA
jgi:hypothetical protein